jgi:hypothetical protein
MYNKKFIRVVSVLILSSLILTGCTNDEDSSQSGSDSAVSLQQADADISGTTEIVEYSDIDFSDPDSVNNGFLNLVWQDNMEDAFKCLKISDTTFVTADDLSYCLRQSNLAGIIGNPSSPPTHIESTIKGRSAPANYYIDETKNIFEHVNCVLDDDNRWKIATGYWFATSYKCYVPTGVRFYLNDVEVTSNYKTGESNGLDIYTIPYLPAKKISTKIISSTFGEITGEITPSAYKDNSNNLDLTAMHEIPKVISTDLFNEVASAVGGMYNQVFSAMENQAGSTILNSVMGGEKNYKFLETDYAKGIEVRRDYKSEGMAKTSCEVLEITQNTSAVSYVYDAKTVVLNMNMKIHWLEDTKPCEENIACAAKVVFENGDWKLDDITSNSWTTLQNGLNTTNENVDAWKKNNVIEE